MRDDQHRFLALLGQLPARLTAEQAAWVLNCQAHDVPVLVVARLLKPLGNPQPNSVKYFATSEVLEHAKDRVWLAKVTNAVSQHWKQKNHTKAARLRADNRESVELSLSTAHVLPMNEANSEGSTAPQRAAGPRLNSIT
jgi:hypothetical protein